MTPLVTRPVLIAARRYDDETEQVGRLNLNLRHRSSEELVELAIEQHGAFKLVHLELSRRAADAGVTARVVAAYRTGRAPPWLAAALLGAVRGPDGYAVAREILLAAPRQLAESYAGVAMARIEGPAARADLTEIMRGDWPRRTCEGAAYGLAVLADPAVVDDLLAARRERRISASCAGHVIAALPGATRIITGWLEGGDHTEEDVAMEAAVSLSAREEGLADRALATALRASLEAGRVKVSPGTRRMLSERIGRVLP